MAEIKASTFDVNGARQAGYSDEEIFDHLSQAKDFDVNGALQAGYSKTEILNHVGSQPGATSQKGTVQSPITPPASHPLDAAAPELRPGWVKTPEGPMPYQQMQKRASEPGAPAGFYEQSAGFGRDASTQTKDSLTPIAMGAEAAAPVMTAGASLPVQAGVQALSSAASAKAQGASNTSAAIQGAVGAAIPVAAHYLPGLVKTAAGRMADEARSARAAFKPIPADVQAAADSGMAAKSTEEINHEVSQKIAGGVHESLDKVAQAAGVDSGSETSISRKASEIGAKVRAQGTAIYQQLDEAFGGRVQRFAKAIEDLEDTLRNKYLPVDDAVKVKVKLIEAQQDFAKAGAEAIEKAGDPKAVKESLDKANAFWKQGRALQDFSKGALATESASGELKPGAASMDSLVKRLHATGRLQQGFGTEAENIRQTAIDATKEVADQHQSVQKAQKAVAQIKEIQGKRKLVYAKVGAAVGAGEAARIGYHLTQK